MRINKKELLEIALVFMLGVLMLLAIAINVKHYDQTHPTQNPTNSSFEMDS